ILFPTTFFCKLEQDGTFTFPGHICCNVKLIWQAIHHQVSSCDSRRQAVSVELEGLLHVRCGIP
uniref:Uncharacterized protein n=1 Tax=Castor canadensis TaxID=51338 RepID=A0A8C0WQ78_CASCN